MRILGPGARCFFLCGTFRRMSVSRLSFFLWRLRVSFMSCGISWRRWREGLKHPKMDQRVVGAMMIGVVGLILLGSLALQLYVGQVFIPDGASAQRKVNIPNRAAYAWLRVNTPAEANVFAFFDPLLYLYTGRHAMSRPLPTALFYADDRAGVLKHYGGLVPYARARTNAQLPSHQRRRLSAGNDR